MTSAAVAIAGRRWSYLQEAWLADLAGAPEEGMPVSGRRRLILAGGFLLAALRLRLRGLAAPAWRPVDWLLAVSTRSNAAVAAAVGTAAVYFDVTEGLHVLLVERSEPCALLGTLLYGLFRWLRRVRGIELSQRARRQDRNP
jgi:hypothetical protein